MKKITLFIFLTFITLGYSQQQQYNLGFEPATPSGIAPVWFTFDNGAPVAEIVTNPDPDGTNTSATTKVLKVVMGPGNAFYAGVNNKYQDAAFGTWKIDAAVPSNLTITMDVNKNYVGTVGIQMITNTGASTFQIVNQNVGNTVVDQWQTLSWTLPAIPPTLETNISAFVVFVDWTQGNPDRAANSTIYIDNIRFNAEKLTDPPVPTCTDGIQNGTETGVDCGGSCSVCILDPIVSAAVPTIPAVNVLSVYSETYPAGNTVSSFNFNAFQGSGTISQVDIQTNGNNSGRINSLSYYGAQWTPVNVSAYNYVHIDYYATSSNNFNFYLIDATAGIPGGNPSEPKYSFGGTTPDAPLVKGSWQSVFIPLSHFDNFNSGSFSYDLNDIFQWKFDGNGNVYFDNIYFSTTNLSTAKFEASNIRMYPNPATTNFTIDADKAVEKVSVHNLLGQEVLSKTPNNQFVTLDISSLQVGVYIVKVTIEGNVSTSRIIKD